MCDCKPKTGAQMYLFILSRGGGGGGGGWADTRDSISKVKELFAQYVKGLLVQDNSGEGG